MFAFFKSKKRGKYADGLSTTFFQLKLNSAAEQQQSPVLLPPRSPKLEKVKDTVEPFVVETPIVSLFKIYPDEKHIAKNN